VAYPLVRDRRVAQVVLDVGQHQAGPVYGEDGVGGLDDLVHRLLDPHLAEAQPAELVQGTATIRRRDGHAGPWGIRRINSQPSISRSASNPVSSSIGRPARPGRRMISRLSA